MISNMIHSVPQMAVQPVKILKGVITTELVDKVNLIITALSLKPLSLVMSLMVSFCAGPFPMRCLG